MSNAPPVTVVYQQPNNGWKNQKQMTSLSAASLIFVSGGLNFALSVGWNESSVVPYTEHFVFCWFIGVMAGGILAAPLITVLQKHFYFKLSALLVLAGGIIFTSVPYNYDALLAARYINGIGVGFATVPFLIHASEISAKSYRGTCLIMEQYSLSLGIAIQVIYTSQWSASTDFSATRLHGIFDIVFGVFAFVASFFMVESPIFYIRKGNDSAALECLRHLQRPCIVTDATRLKLEEYKQYVQQNENLGFAGSCAVGWAPLIKLCFYRGLVALTFSLPLTDAVVLASFISIGYRSWPPLLYGLLRLVGALLMVRLYDSMGRKLLAKIALLISAGLIIAVGCILDYDTIYQDDMTAIATLLLIYQLFAGIFVPSSSVYLGEAFPLLVKPYYIALTLIVENLVQLIITCTFVISIYNMYVFTISVGAISLFLFLFFSATMPETRRTTLQEAQARNGQVVYLKFY